MRLEQLQYFVQVVESHSFNRAARHLNITQPALTNSIRALEEELGVQLLIRSRRGCVPTSWGVRIYEDCKSLLSELSAKMASWRSLGAGRGRTDPVMVPVVAIPSACNYLAEHVFSQIKTALPLVDIVLHEATVYDLYSFLQKGKAHIGVTAFSDGEAEKLINQYRETGFRCEPLMEDEYYIFLSTRHPLATKEKLTPADCATLTLATYSNQILKRNQLFQKKVFDVVGITRYSYVNSRENIMQMVAQNKAAGCFLHRMSAYSWYITNGLIRALPVEGMRLMPSFHYLVSLERNMLSSEERQVVDFIRSRYDGDVSSLDGKGSGGPLWRPEETRAAVATSAPAE